MADKLDTVSFDVDTRAAIAAVDKYIDSLTKLNTELVAQQKAGKSTADTQAKIAQTTQALNKVLNQETTTTKGVVAQMLAAEKATNKLQSATATAEKQATKFSNSQQKQIAGFARLTGGAKNLTSALTRGAAGLSNLIGGFGISAAAIGVAANAATGLITSLKEVFFQSAAVAEVQASVEEATKGVITEYVSEARSLNGLLAPLGDTNTSSKERKAIIEEIQSKYPQYLENIDLETVNSKNLADIQKVLNQRLLEGIVLKAKQAEQEKILAKIIELNLQLQKATTPVTENFARTAGNAIGGLLGYGDALGAAAVATNELSGEFQKAQLQKQIAELTEENNNLDETFANLTKDIAALNLNLGATTEGEDLLAKNALKAKKETDVLKGSLADLEAQLSNVNKLLNEQTNLADKQTIVDLGQEYQRLSAEIAKARAEIERATKAQSVDLAARLGGVKAQLKTVEDTQEANLRALKLTTEQLELQRQLELNRIEAERQRGIKVATNATAEAIVNADAAKKRATVEKEADLAILQSRLAVQEQLREIAISNNQSTVEAETEIANLKAAILKLTENEYAVKIGTDEASRKTTIEKLKKTVGEIANAVETLGGQAFEFLQSGNQQAIQAADNAIAKQKEVLDALLANEQTTNVERVRLEQERLDKLQAAREKAKEREAVLAQAQIALNLAVAVARAVAEGGGIGSAITVAAAISAAIIGFVKAKQASTQAFYKGTTFARRAPGEPAGRDTINARIDEGEAIIPTATNAQYKDAVEAIYYKRVPASALNEFAKNYGKMRADSTDFLRGMYAAHASRDGHFIKMSRAANQPAKTSAPNSNSESQAMMAALDVFVAEIRKWRAEQRGGKRSRVSDSDARGKVLRRLGVRKVG